MSRSLNPKRSGFYRVLIETLQDDGTWKAWTGYGPYHTKSACRDHDARWYRDAYEKGTRRKRVQVQDVDPITAEIVWRDV